MDSLKLILNDGTEILGGSAYANGNSLFLSFRGYTFKQAVDMAVNPEKTAVIQYVHDDIETFEGFTECTGVNLDIAGTISVCLVKG